MDNNRESVNNDQQGHANESKPYCFSCYVHDSTTIRFCLKGNRPYHDPDKKFFFCRDQEYNKNIDESNLTLFLNEISNSNPNLNEIYIIEAINPDIIDGILYYFLSCNHVHIRTIFFGWCINEAIFKSRFFQNNGCIDGVHTHHVDVTNNQNTNRNAVIASNCCTIKLKEVYIDSDNDMEAIKNCSFFPSWCITGNNGTIKNYLNILAQNSYIQSLHIIFSEHSWTFAEPEDMIVDSITNLVNCTHTLSKLAIDFTDIVYDSINADAVNNLSDALIQSLTITDLSFRTYDLNKDSLQQYRNIVCSVMEQKTNIKTLKLDLSLFLIDDYFQFDATIFINLFQNNKGLQKLDVNLPLFHKKSSKEILLFFELLKNSLLKDITIRFSDIRRISPMLACNADESFIYKTLLKDTIPFMTQLCYIQLLFWKNRYDVNGDELYNYTLNSLIKSVGICSRTIMGVYTVEKDDVFYTANNDVDQGIEKYLMRNKKLTDCIIEKNNNIPKTTLPKIFTVAKPTGPDTAFHVLCNLGLAIRSESFMTTRKMIETKRIH